MSETDAGDAAAGDLVGGERLAVFVCEVAEAVGLGGLFQPVDEGFHFRVKDFLGALEADVDDYEGSCRGFRGSLLSVPKGGIFSSCFLTMEYISAITVIFLSSFWVSFSFCVQSLLLRGHSRARLGIVRPVPDIRSRLCSLRHSSEVIP